MSWADSRMQRTHEPAAESRLDPWAGSSHPGVDPTAARSGPGQALRQRREPRFPPPWADGTARYRTLSVVGIHSK
jgi:hypothetical protein